MARLLTRWYRDHMRDHIKVIKLYKSVQDYSMELHLVELYSVELHSAELCSVELCLVELSSNLNLYSRNTHFFKKKGG